MAEPTSGAAILARIQPTLLEESVEILMGNKLLDEWEGLQEQLLASREKDQAGNRLADRHKESPRTRKLAEKVAAVEEKIADQAVKVTFRSMTKDKWRALCDTYPPRQGDLIDAHAGYNRDAVLDEAVRKCMIEPVFADCTDRACEHTGCGTWQQFEAVVPPGQWELLKETVNSANRGVVDAPKSALASRILRRPATT